MQLGEHSLANAKEKGFQAMQFNAVVSTNTRAVELWKRLGFAIIGTVPKGFSSPGAWHGRSLHHAPLPVII
jgi:ribosomal protein S18 acetylase RimI-like enzyme